MNNKLLNTTSEKMKKSSFILKYIYEKIIDNQKIKRLLIYNTANPLGEKGIDYSGRLILQPDIDADDERVKEVISPNNFNPEMVDELRNSLYMGITNGNFKYGGNVLTLRVNILSPIEYVDTVEGYRYFDIGTEIANILDQAHVDEENWVKYMGNLKFDLVSYEIYRLSKINTMMWLSMCFEIELFPFART